MGAMSMRGMNAYGSLPRSSPAKKAARRSTSEKEIETIKPKIAEAQGKVAMKRAARDWESFSDDRKMKFAYNRAQMRRNRQGI